MVFNSDIFLFVFLPVLFTLFWLSKTKQQRYVLLTLSGYVFYGYWNWRYCGLLLFSSVVSYSAGLLVEGSASSRWKRFWVLLSVSVDLTLLGFFKYYNFFVANMTCVFPHAPLPLISVVLPVGISFYTFHTISYIVDVAAGRVRAARDMFEYFTYVCLFSQLVAGPIVRYRQIEEDLDNIDGLPPQDWFARGIGFFVVGLIKKVIVADQIALRIDPLLSSYGNLSQWGAWMAALGYTFQLYYDFSGYSDMAIGLGYLFKIRIPQNFNAPYRALGIRDFWRRWHISLSSWLRDYLYIPLGGSRKGPFRTNVHLMITMLLGGLWHGAAWNFVLWGAYHGLLLILDRACETWAARLHPLAYRWLTFLLVIFGWVLFRSTSLGMAVNWMGKLLGLGVGAESADAMLLCLVVACSVAVNILPETWDIRFGTRLRWAAIYAAAFVLAYLFLNSRKTVFLYYQF